jgi:RimJ/RimL family protein N-acetyltransferase
LATARAQSNTGKGDPFPAPACVLVTPNASVGESEIRLILCYSRFMHIETRRFVLRDFSERDRQPFIDYQMDPRYRRLYDLSEADPARANTLFDLFGDWRCHNTRQNYQVGIFDRIDSILGGCAGLRRSGQAERAAVFGLELSPNNWGRFGMAVECSGALLEYGFLTLNLDQIIGTTASGNSRIEALALWFGASVVGRRHGTRWMKMRGWHEVDWALSRAAWEVSPGRHRHLRASHP